VLCVPGGVGVNALMEDQEVLEFLRRRSEEARYVTSVCTGALVLAAAGLLNGRRATTHWASHDLLAPLGAVPERARVVVDGRFISGGGVTAGIDMALTVVAELLGRDQAEAVQHALEYAPAPPFESGDPASARPETVARVRAGYATSRAERERIVARLAATAGR
jgi:cyclohexyl-isocyanide hydratase